MCDPVTEARMILKQVGGGGGGGGQGLGFRVRV